jgi:23S rRNA (cytosine1962-C5)-methyltransferase
MKADELEARIDAAIGRRRALLVRDDLDAVRLVNGEGDGLAGLFVDRVGRVLVAAVDEALPFGPLLVRLIEKGDANVILRKTTRARNGRASAAAPADRAPDVVFVAAGATVPDEAVVREGELRFVVRPKEAGSHGLFLDQRENRARLAALLRERVQRRDFGGGAPSVLNLFAFTCSFSVAAAKAGAHVTSVDLAARCLEWGERNFAENGLDARQHDFVKGDALTFLEIGAKKRRTFDAIVLDPPTFATSRKRGVFQVERDYARLFELACRVAAPRATILASHNLRTLTRRELESKLREGARAAGRSIARVEPFPPPADFPGSDRVNPAARGCWTTLVGSP